MPKADESLPMQALHGLGTAATAPLGLAAAVGGHFVDMFNTPQTMGTPGVDIYAKEREKYKAARDYNPDPEPDHEPRAPLMPGPAPSPSPQSGPIEPCYDTPAPFLPGLLFGL